MAFSAALSHHTDVRRLVGVSEAFAAEFPHANVDRSIGFDSKFPHSSTLVGCCEYKFDDRWWRSDIYMGTFKNPRDGRALWKEIIFKLPNDGFIYSTRHKQPFEQKLDADTKKLLHERFSSLFPLLVGDKPISFEYFGVGMDRLNISWEDVAKKEKFYVTFEYFPPVADA